MATGAQRKRHSWDSAEGGKPAAAIIRLLGLLLLVTVAFGAAVVFLVSVGLVNANDLMPNQTVRQCLSGFAEQGLGMTRWTTAGLALVVSVGAILLLVAGVSAGQRSTGEYLLSADERGVVFVDAAGIRAVAEAAALRTSGVMEVRARVGGHVTGPVRLRLEAWVIPGSDLKQAGTRAKAAAEEAVEQLVGIDVRGVTIKMNVLADEKLGMRVV